MNALLVPSARRPAPRLLVPRALVVIVVVCVLLASFRYGSPRAAAVPSHRLRPAVVAKPDIAQKRLVPLEAHIISKCPDTKDALRRLILPVMLRVQDKVDFKLSYIGTLTDDGGIECKHGSSECLGNIIELCARELYPQPKIYLGFVMCLTMSYKDIPDRSLIEDCALEHAIDMRVLNECATADDGAHGMALLRESVRRSQQANVTVSCTVRLDNKVYCVRDNGGWKDCPHGHRVDDLADEIEKRSRSA